MYQQQEPVKLKPPVSPYITFCVTKRPEVKAMYPTANFGDIGRMLGNMWAGLSHEEKQVCNSLNF